MSDRSAKKKLTTYQRAHAYACRGKARKSADTWNDGERGTYWWGLFEGYQAGVRAGRKEKK